MYVFFRATPTIWHILFGISCVLPTYKKICQVKNSSSKQLVIIQLPNSDLTYIGNLREKQNYVYTLLPLQNLHQEPFYFCFHPPTKRETSMATGVVARIFTRWEAWDAELLLMTSCFAKLLEAFFLFHQN
jgi:hypothetical protein